MALDPSKDVQGFCVYTELTLDSATAQVIIIPDGYSQDGTKVAASIIRRIVSPETPKKQWKFSSLPDATFVPANDAECESYTEQRMVQAAKLFDQYQRGGWSIVQTPIVLEVSRKDYDDVKEGKTPTKLIYRITQSRIALDFPDNIIHTSV